MASLVIGVVGIGVLTTSFFLGFLDRPKFILSTLLRRPDDDDDIINEPWFAIVAVCREKDISKHVMALILATVQGIQALQNGKEILKEGCKTYLAGTISDQPEEVAVGCKTLGVDSLCVGFFLDDPSEVESPRWAIGWAVRGLGSCKLAAAGDSQLPQEVAQQQAIRETIQEKSGLCPEKNPIRIVRLPGSTPVLRASIPWRSSMTPAIAPMLHWKRGFDECARAGYATTCSGEGPIAMEVYVMNGQKWFASYIDYNVVHGDNASIWKDILP